MKMEHKQPVLRMVIFIAAPRTARKAEMLFREGNIPLYYQFHGKGTASSEMMDILGLGSTDKRIFLSIMPKMFADRLMKKMYETLKLNRPDSGIAFSVVMSGGSSMAVNMLSKMNAEEIQLIRERNVRIEMPESKYTMIMIIANQGYSEEVMDAARTAGAAGGTVFHARQAVNEEILSFWGIHIQPEREITIILAREEDKLEIMKAVAEKCGVNSEARGIAFSLPVDHVVGLVE